MTMSQGECEKVKGLLLSLLRRSLLAAAFEPRT